MFKKKKNEILFNHENAMLNAFRELRTYNDSVSWILDLAGDGRAKPETLFESELS